MFNTCCCGKYPQCIDQRHFTSRAHQKGKEEFKKEYNTGKAECTPDFTFPERAIKVIGHLQSAKRDQRAVSESRLNTSPALSLSSESPRITISIRPARGTTIPWHTFFFLLNMEWPPSSHSGGCQRLMPIKAGTERSLFSSLVSKTANSRELISLTGFGTWHDSFYSFFSENRQRTLHMCYDDLLRSTVRLYKEELL